MALQRGNSHGFLAHLEAPLSRTQLQRFAAESAISIFKTLCTIVAMAHGSLSGICAHRERTSRSYWFFWVYFNAKALEEPFSVCILQPNFNSHISRSHFTLFSSVCVEMELGQSCPSAGRDLCPHCGWISPGSQHRLSSSLAPVPCLKASQKISWG